MISAVRRLALVLLCTVCSVSFAAERDFQAQLNAWGLSDLVPASASEAASVRGQGFTFGASRSASAIPGTFSHNFASALGEFSAEAETGASSELRITAAQSLHVAESEFGERQGFELDHFHYPLGYAGGWGPWLGSSYEREITIGSSGYARASQN